MNDAQRSQADFDQTSTRLESSVREACGQSVEWPAKVAAGVYAALEFASTDEAAFRRLLLGKVSAGRREQARYSEAIDGFARLLGAEAPKRHPVSDGKPVIRSLAAMIAEPLRSGRPQRLAEIGPELVQMVLQPYLSFGEAKSWAERTSRSPSAAGASALQ
jgi:hypothetical protein